MKIVFLTLEEVLALHADQIGRYDELLLAGTNKLNRAALKARAAAATRPDPSPHSPGGVRHDR